MSGNPRPPLPEGRWEIRGPTEDIPVVEAWADDYVRFERRPPWQEQLRDAIRTRCKELKLTAEQVLHASITCDKPVNADIENLLLYNIGSFKEAGRNGIRFEHGNAVPAAPSCAAEYPVYYRYAVAQRSAPFAAWRLERQIASFDWIELGEFAGERKLAKLWLALHRNRVEPFFPAIPAGREFAVKVQVRPPRGSKRVWANLVKEVFDGVICAFQAHTDESVLPEVTERLAKHLHAHPEDLQRYLRDQCRAVLGATERLVSPYQSGVKWNPADHWCVAGELLAAEPTDDHWALKGQIIELAHCPGGSAHE